ncbi:MAG: hypothetical protein JNM18_23870, partial [Planctomycetaceae bacterium]|nr:hypothetical protein [Planctomycetaceae bacterium]
HSSLMIAQRTQSHQLPGEAALGTRVTAAGYTNWQGLGENIYAYAENTFHGHAGFVVDWGNNPPGHRDNIMDADWKEVGIDATPHTPLDGSDVGPLVITQDFGTRFNYGNSYLVGVVYVDNNGNTRYTAGEGLAGITVTATPVAGGSSYTTTTMTAGGYQLQVPNGTYTVTVTGAALGTPRVMSNVVVSSANRKVDFNALVAPIANVAPVNTIPVAQATRPNTPVVFNTANGNAISIADADAGAGSVRVTLTVDTGTLTLPSTSGLSFSVGNGSAAATMTFAGSIANINAALNGLTFTPASGFVGGAAQLSITTNDLGNTGGGGALVDTDSLYIYVNNDFVLAGNSLNVTGTTANDDFWITFTDASNFNVTLNGVTQARNLSAVNAVFFYLGGGDDTVRITLAPGSDTVTMRPGEFQAIGVGYNIFGSGGNTQTCWAWGTAGVGYLYDSAGNDTYTGQAANTILSGPGFSNQLLNLTTVYTFGSGLGTDTASMYSGSNADVFYGLPNNSIISGTNSYQYVEKFDRVYGFGIAGGTGTAILIDAPTNDTFTSLSGYSILSGLSFFNQATTFSKVYAFGNSGGDDVAAFYDSAGDDYFFGVPDSAYMQGTGFLNQAIHFDSAVGNASTGRDTAIFYDSVGNDTFYRDNANAYLIGSNFRNYAVGFDVVYALSNYGTDTASIFDSTGSDALTANSNLATLITPAQTIYLYGFRTVTATASSGGRDTVQRGTISFVLNTSGLWVRA